MDEPRPFPEQLAHLCAIIGASSDIARQIDIRPNDVMRNLAAMDLNLQWLLNSPQGWTILGVIIACMYGLEAPDHGPTIH